METAVKEKEVTNPRRRLIVRLSVETREAPTITAKPIIKQFNGLVNRRSPVSFPIIVFQLGVASNSNINGYVAV